MKLTLNTLPGRYSITQFPRSAALPVWATAPENRDEFYSISYSSEEISVVSTADKVPKGAKSERDWAVLKVDGDLDFSLTGILSDIAGALAERKIPIFAISTFNTDYILVPYQDLADSQSALRSRGHTII